MKDKNFFSLIRRKWTNLIIKKIIGDSSTIDLKQIGLYRDKFKIFNRISNNMQKENLINLIENEFKFWEIIFLINIVGEENNLEYIKNRSDRLHANSVYTKTIYKILSDIRLPLYIRQLKVENYIIEYESNYFLNSVEDGNVSTLLKVQTEVRKIIIKHISKLCKDYTINNYKKIRNNVNDINSQCVLLICMIEFEIIANLIFVTSLKNISGDNNISQEKLCINLANRVINQFKITQSSILKNLKKNNEMDINLYKNMKDINSWTDVEKICLGQLLLECIIKTDIFNIDIERQGKKTYNNLNIKREFMQILSNISININRLPMVCKPLD